MACQHYDARPISGRARNDHSVKTVWQCLLCKKLLVHVLTSSDLRYAREITPDLRKYRKTRNEKANLEIYED